MSLTRYFCGICDEKLFETKWRNCLNRNKQSDLYSGRERFRSDPESEEHILNQYLLKVEDVKLV